MIEFGVDNHTPIDVFDGQKKGVGTKPLLVFTGDQWDTDSTFMRVQNLLLDFFRGDKISMISLKGVDNVISCSISEGKIYLRSYSVKFLKSGTKVCLYTDHPKNIETYLPAT
jgi:ribosome production factor 2